VTLTRQRVARLVSHAKTVASPPIATAAVAIPERTRPLNSALNQAENPMASEGR
jgi:hypothetical protein